MAIVRSGTTDNDSCCFRSAALIFFSITSFGRHKYAIAATDHSVTARGRATKVFWTVCPEASWMVSWKGFVADMGHQAPSNSITCVCT